MNVNRKQRRFRASEDPDSRNRNESGLLNERILVLIFKSINWDPHIVCLISCVSRKLSAIAKRVLWKELCRSRAPRMIPTLLNGEHNLRIGDGWQALAKLLFFCCGSIPSQHFPVNQILAGHFVKTSRFSKTCGQSFLMKKFHGDLLYISDPCEHTLPGNLDDLGVFRGVFRGFMKSKTRACLIKRQVEFEQGIRCPYCGQRVWSMTSAKLVPKSAAKRLGSHHENLEYFVCVNGHLHGSCLLVPLSSDENYGMDDDDEDDVEDCEEEDGNGVTRGNLENGRMSSSGEEIWEGGTMGCGVKGLIEQ